MVTGTELVSTDAGSRKVNETTVDNASYYYEFLNNALNYGNFCTAKELNTGTKDLSFFANLAKPVINFQEKPKEPKSNLASMGIYIFNWDILKKYLIEDEADPTSENDFGNNIIPNLLRDGRKMYAYHFNGYWKDVGTIPSLWEANMEVLDPEHSGINLFDENWKIYSRNSGMTGHRIGENAVLDNCLITDGCNIKGTVRHSILFSGVTVEEGAIVEDAVVMGHSTIKAGAVVRHCIIAENATIEEDAVVGAKPEGEGVGEVATIAADVTIRKGAKIGPSAMIYEDVKEGEEQC